MSAGRKVQPNTPTDDAWIARIDPELGEANSNGLNVHLLDKFQVQFLDDNQATMTIITKGDSEKMRK